jgi:Spy/CpxP family protein refolding chaperone
MQRPAPMFLFVLTFVLGGLLGAAPIHAGDEKKVIDAKPDAPKVAAPKAVGRAKVPAAARSRDENALWWNDPVTQEALTLTDEQREKMDGYLAAYRKQLPPDRRAAAFHESLVQGTWKQARSEIKKLSEMAEAAVRTRGALKIDVLALLSKEQHQKLVDQYPRLIYKAWTRAMRK